ncbi:MAG: HEAT repeat domain-containing protein [Pseudomonadota bacterium]
MRYAEAAVTEQASARLNAALAAGSHPDPRQIETLLARCAVETDFFVRDMLTWALTRHPPEQVVPRLLQEVRSTVRQARSQALHTLSKIKAPGTWSAITPALLRDADDEVARSAWRTAVVLVPVDQKSMLAAELASQFGRGDRQMQISLSRALVSLGEESIALVLRNARNTEDPLIRAHADATERLLANPDGGFVLDIEAARRAFTLGKER